MLQMKKSMIELDNNKFIVVPRLPLRDCHAIPDPMGAPSDLFIESALKYIKKHLVSLDDLMECQVIQLTV